MLPVKKIVCPTDFSEPSMAALDTACELAQHFDAELKILHVLPTMPIYPNEMGLAVIEYFSSDSERRTEAKEKIASLVQERVPKGVHVAIEVCIGDAPLEITRVAKDDSADLIVLGTHGETGWRFLAIGSVAAKVVRMAHRPVLTTYGGPLPENAEHLGA